MLFRELLPERDSYASVGYALSLLVGLLTSIANPVLYTIFNTTFKRQVKRKFSFITRKNKNNSENRGSIDLS
jgi:hypothetical protein